MQPRKTMIALLGAMTVFYVVLFTYSYFFPAPAPTTQPATQPTTQAAPTTQPAGTTTAPTAERGPATTIPSTTGDVRFDEGPSREHVFMGSADDAGAYPMRLEIDPVGAEVVNAWLRGYYESVKKEAPYRVLSPVQLPGGGIAGSFATPEIRFEDRKLTVSLAGRVWKLDTDASTETKQVWVLPILDTAGQPLANIIKTYELKPQPAKQRTYDLEIALSIQNLTGAASRVTFWQQGAVGFRKDTLRYEDRSVVVGMWNGDEVKAAAHPRKDVAKGGGTLALGKDEDSTRLAWVGAGNNFFAGIMTPAGRTSANVPILISSAEAMTLVTGDTPPGDADPSDETYRFAVTPLDVPANGTAGVAFDCYLGPKSRPGFLDVEEYRQRDYYAFMKATYYTCCAPAPLTGFMMSLLNFFHRIVPNYGVAIIMLVILVRTILHPLTKRGQVNMVKMQKQMARLQPKMEVIKQKYANDRAALSQAQMELYKEEGVNPAGQMMSCLPMAFQMPILGALWAALAASVEIRHAPFDGYWINDLAGPDALISWAAQYPQGVHVPILSWMAGPVNSFNLLPILMGISQMLQMKFMPKVTSGPGAVTGPAAQQMEQQRKMMTWMSLLFVVMFYNQPSGLNLYWMASNLFGILEQWRIRKHIADIESKPPPEPSPDDKKPGPPKKPSRFIRVVEYLQKQADEAKKQPGQRK